MVGGSYNTSGITIDQGDESKSIIRAVHITDPSKQGISVRQGRKAEHTIEDVKFTVDFESKDKVKKQWCNFTAITIASVGFLFTAESFPPNVAVAGKMFFEWLGDKIPHFLNSGTTTEV
ncbi:hypothetical protein SUGI_0959090 [Cryptomeria japonica]|uniref:uncharacterized protein LOC131052111 n=1 Tax=Cryptomeria japonica TaxID=3369 RepID=UPI002414AB20|nr:uncharacterized protein LOC131052111 [Cryptomeria japonica]GLJ45557.1 hypothetical protein SUGI_0959090 [Cryptomeria japonica]